MYLPKGQTRVVPWTRHWASLAEGGFIVVLARAPISLDVQVSDG